MIAIQNYYLDTNSVGKILCEREKEIIHGYYSQMLMAFEDKREESCKSIFHTLFYNGFLKEVRNKKIENVLSR